jgi:hypothetical protein
MYKDDERKQYTPKKDYQPEVTTADLTEKVNGHLNTLIEAIKSGNTAAPWLDNVTETHLCDILPWIKDIA